MSRPVIERKSKGENIGARIDAFIEKLKNIPDDSSKIAACVRNELRWLGVESDNPKYGIGTIKTYLTKYRAAISQDLWFSKLYKTQLEKLNKQHNGIFSEILSINGSPADHLAAIRAHAASMADKTSGAYDGLRRLKPAHPAYYKMKLRAGQVVTMKEAENRAVIDRKKNKISISRLVAQEAVNEGLASKTIYKTLVALMLCSGRRPSELYKTASFALKKGGGCIFTGQGKKKAGNSNESLHIPILFIPEKTFLQLFLWFQKRTADTAELSREQINSRISSDAPATARKMLSNTDATLYTCRAVYASMAAEQQPEIDRDIYMASILGHTQDDIETVNCYQCVRLTDTPAQDARAAYDKQLELESRQKTNKKPARGRPEKPEKPATKTAQNAAQKLARQLERIAAGNPELMRGAVARINNWAIEYATGNPDAVFTQTLITKQLGASRPAIRKWLEITEKARAT